MSLAEQYDDIARCNKCGFCQVACPVFRATGDEAGVARGRIALMRALIEERIAWTKELEEPLFNCLRCGACTANCFPAVATGDLLGDARSEYLDRVGRSVIHRTLFRHLLPNPARLRRAARAVAFGKNRGLSRIARAIGMLRAFGGDLAKAEDIVERMPDRAYRSLVPPGVLDGSGERLRIAYFVGCGIDLLCPGVAGATVDLLRKLGRTVHVLENCCCGLPAETYGDREARLNLASKNLEILDPDSFDLIVTDCSSCAAFLRKYPSFFHDGDPRRTKAEAVAKCVRDILQLVDQVRQDERDRVPDGVPRKPLVVTWHDPCHASRGEGLVKEPRALLQSLPGIEYREMPEADWCCGGAGSYALSHFELSQRILKRKMDNVEKTGADVLVTSCPACIVQLRYGVRLRGLRTRVRHISEVIVDAGREATEE